MLSLEAIFNIRRCFFYMYAMLEYFITLYFPVFIALLFSVLIIISIINSLIYSWLQS